MFTRSRSRAGEVQVPVPDASPAAPAGVKKNAVHLLYNYCVAKNLISKTPTQLTDTVADKIFNDYKSITTLVKCCSPELNIFNDEESNKKMNSSLLKINKRTGSVTVLPDTEGIYLIQYNEGPTKSYFFYKSNVLVYYQELTAGELKNILDIININNSLEHNFDNDDWFKFGKDITVTDWATQNLQYMWEKTKVPQAFRAVKRGVEYAGDVTGATKLYEAVKEKVWGGKESGEESGEEETPARYEDVSGEWNLGAGQEEPGEESGEEGTPAGYKEIPSEWLGQEEEQEASGQEELGSSQAGKPGLLSYLPGGRTISKLFSSSKSAGSIPAGPAGIIEKRGQDIEKGYKTAMDGFGNINTIKPYKNTPPPQRTEIRLPNSFKKSEITFVTEGNNLYRVQHTPIVGIRVSI
jgi:hypothetical protein